jgi:hypothetical protein
MIERFAMKEKVMKKVFLLYFNVSVIIKKTLGGEQFKNTPFN